MNIKSANSPNGRLSNMLFQGKGSGFGSHSRSLDRKQYKAHLKEQFKQLRMRHIVKRRQEKSQVLCQITEKRRFEFEEKLKIMTSEEIYRHNITTMHFKQQQLISLQGSKESNFEDFKFDRCGFRQSDLDSLLGGSNNNLDNEKDNSDLLERDHELQSRESYNLSQT